MATVIPGLSKIHLRRRVVTGKADRRWYLGGKRSRRSRGFTDVKWVVAKILKVPLAGQTGSRLPAGIELRPPLDWQHANQFTEHDPEGAERLIELIRHAQRADRQAESVQPNE